MGLNVIFNKYHKVVLYVTTFGLAIYGIIALINPEMLSAGFYKFTNQEWRQFQINNNEIAAYITLLWRLIGIFNVMAGFTLTLMIWKWLRPGTKWAWINLLFGTSLAYLGPMITDMILGSIEIFEVIEFVLFGLFIIVMLLIRTTYCTHPEK